MRMRTGSVRAPVPGNHLPTSGYFCIGPQHLEISKIWSPSRTDWLGDLALALALRILQWPAADITIRYF
jgi:hypothetical protein